MSKHFLCKYVTMNHGFFILKQKTTTSKNHITHLVSGKLGADFASQKTRIACRNVTIFAQTSFHVQVPKMFLIVIDYIVILFIRNRNRACGK